MTKSHRCVPLNNELFFKYFACNAFGAQSAKLLNKKDQLKGMLDFTPVIKQFGSYLVKGI